MLTGMSSGKSEGSHSGPYGATVMTSFSWFSGNSESSRNCMANLLRKLGGRASGGLAPQGKLFVEDGHGKVAGVDADDARNLEHLDDLRACRARCERGPDVMSDRGGIQVRGRGIHA